MWMSHGFLSFFLLLPSFHPEASSRNLKAAIQVTRKSTWIKDTKIVFVFLAESFGKLYNLMFNLNFPPLWTQRYEWTTVRGQGLAVVSKNADFFHRISLRHSALLCYSTMQPLCLYYPSSETQRLFLLDLTLPGMCSFNNITILCTSLMHLSPNNIFISFTFFPLLFFFQLSWKKNHLLKKFHVSFLNWVKKNKFNLAIQSIRLRNPGCTNKHKDSNLLLRFQV